MASRAQKLYDRSVLARIDQGAQLNPDELQRISANRGLSNRLKEVSERQAAQVGLEQRKAAMAAQNQLLSQGQQITSDLFSRLQQADQGPSAETAANVEVERRRRALMAGQEQMQRGLNQNVARRGLGGTASALFAGQRANQAQQDRLLDLESSRLDLQEGFRDKQLERRRDLLNQYYGATGQTGNVIGGMNLPGVDYSRQKSGLAKVAGGIGRVLGTLGPSVAGAIAGGFAGKGTQNLAVTRPTEIGVP